MSISGRLRLSIDVDRGRVRRARVENSRPLAAHLLAGRRVDEAVALASALFSLCGHAQGLGARLCLDAALGRAPGDALGRRRSVVAELAQEHLWRLLIDWPELLGMPARRSAFAALHRQLAAVAAQRAEQAPELAAMAAEAGLSDFAGGSAADLATACRRAGALGQLLARVIERAPRTPFAPALLPDLGADHWGRALPGGMPDERFCRRPEHQGAPAETGALARCATRAPVVALLAEGHACAARVVARALELSDAAGWLAGGFDGFRADAATVAEGIGISCVQTARGVLLHGARVVEGKVADYRIVAPTEWNFHPAGVFLKEVAVIHAASDAAALDAARQLALALDPCVSWEVDAEQEAVHA
ncbi:MAG: nickel-dependent hydrogenase large subunit [Rhodocyclaceae bacterium]|nr:nickel-dependent hydrogenase large subunit [Rhodocyclaceae bacterium]